MSDKPVALITGSSSGIGAEIARAFGTDGMRIVVNSAHSTESGNQIADELPEAVYVQADVADPQQVQSLVDSAVEHFGRLDVLVNNAGVSRPIPHEDLEQADLPVWQEIFGVNVFGTWQTTVAAMPALRASGVGSVINISSIAGSRPAGSSIPYAVSKAAIEHMTRLLAKTTGPEVRVNAIAPGLVETPWTHGKEFFTPIADEVRRRTPLRRTGSTGDVAEAARALVSASYTTGQVLLVDGGAHLV